MISYIPVVHCAKCGKTVPADHVKRRMSGARGNAQDRYVEASCHGEVARVAFVDKPGREVTAW
jgi:ribosomal protein S26